MRSGLSTEAEDADTGSSVGGDVRMRLDRSGLSSDPAAGPDPEADDRPGSLMGSLGVALRVGGRRDSQRAEEADRAMSGLARGSVEGPLVPRSSGAESSASTTSSRWMTCPPPP